MKRLPLFACGFALGLGIAPMVQGNPQAQNANNKANVRYALNGAFRDGLYLGRLAAANGERSHAAAGRWSTPEDRASFSDGYSAGYEEIVASGTSTASPPRIGQ
jgi:hypothetical protein